MDLEHTLEQLHAKLIEAVMLHLEIASDFQCRALVIQAALHGNSLLDE